MLAASFFRAKRDQIRDLAADPAALTTIVTSTKSSQVFYLGTPVSGSDARFTAGGYLRQGRVFVEIDCSSTGRTPTAAINCARQMLVAQAAKAKPLTR